MGDEPTRVLKEALAFILLAFALIGVRPLGMVAAQSDSLGSPVATGVATTEPTASAAVPTEDPTPTEEPTASDVVVPTQPSQVPPPTVTPIATSKPAADVLGSPEATAPIETEGVSPAKETLTIHVINEHGEPLTGACFSISPMFWNGVCDGYYDVNDGAVHASLQPGEYTVSQTYAPAGYGPAAPIEVTILAGEPAEITVQDEPRPVLTVHKVDEHGEPLTDSQGGACFELTSSEGYRVACDGHDGTSDGEITLLGTVGSFVLTEVRAPLGYVLPDSFDVNIVGGPNEITVENLPPVTLIIHKINEQGEPLSDAAGGACFVVGPDPASSGCDGEDGANDGTITLESTVGTHTLRETRAPGGYLLAPLQQVTIVAGGSNEVTVANFLAETVTIHKVDENGEPLTDGDRGACFTLGFDQASFACDSTDGVNDGTITLSAMPGSQTLEEFSSPRGYSLAEPQHVTIVTGGPNEFTVEDKPLPTLTVLKVDENGNPATDTDRGACFEVLLEDGNFCDSDDGSNDGEITLQVRPGWNYLTETRNPAGYGGWLYDEPVYVADGVQNEITVTNVKLQTVTIYKVDEEGESLIDACFELFDDLGNDDEDIPPLVSACDSDDGANDGATVLPNAPPEFLWLVESRAPKGYAHARTQLVHIVSGGPNEITVPNVRQQTLTVYLVDDHGNPLISGPWPYYDCFALYGNLYDDESEYVACDDYDGANDGTIVFPAVDPQTYWLVQYSAPKGYARSEPLRVDVLAGGPTQVTVVNALLGEKPPATATHGPTTTPAEESPSADSTATDIGGVQTMPSTGVGPDVGSDRDALQILAGMIVMVLLGVFGWLRWRFSFDRHG
jgi:uncharacterized surface anchored protein